MNKQEFQQKIKDMKPPKFFTAITLGEAYKAGFEEAKGNALYNSGFLNEPKKPVVPQFVADWYEEHKDDFEYSIYGLCIDFNNQILQDDLQEWFESDVNKPIETLVKMKLFGYEVEKEKLYTVEIPIHSNPDHVVLRKYVNGKVCIDYYLFDDWRDYKCFQLTESEIKKDHNWAWKYAKEVK